MKKTHCSIHFFRNCPQKIRSGSILLPPFKTDACFVQVRFRLIFHGKLLGFDQLCKELLQIWFGWQVEKDGRQPLLL